MATPVPAVLAQHFFMALMKLRDGWSGADFAEWLDAGYPDAISALRQIGSDLTPPVPPVDAIIDIANSIPQVWSQIEPVPGLEAKLRTYLAEIITWQPEPDQEEEQPS